MTLARTLISKEPTRFRFDLNVADKRCGPDELKRRLCYAWSKVPRRGEVCLGWRNLRALVDVRLRARAKPEAQPVQFLSEPVEE